MPFKNPHPLYGVWHSMKERCRNKNFRQWHNYGGRGIRVCEQWLGPNGFVQFVSDMGDRPTGYTLDRINNDGNYEPSNCRWASRRDQQHNQTVTRKVTIDGVEYVAAKLAYESGLKTDTIIARAKQGLPMKEVISKERRIFKPGLALGGIANGAKQKAKTHCPNGHLYSEENLGSAKNGWRRCKICHKEREAAKRSSRR